MVPSPSGASREHPPVLRGWLCWGGQRCGIGLLHMLLLLLLLLLVVVLWLLGSLHGLGVGVPVHQGAQRADQALQCLQARLTS